jgi:tetratricopeptide (TPR) repeat protein
MFRGAGLDAIDDDPAVLSVRGRLLKDRALAAPAGPERRRFYLDAAGAYGRAAVISGAAYPLINAATLWLLGGHPEQSRALADQVLQQDAGAQAEPETPYYRAATRAEALLLLGRIGEAREAFEEAIGQAPRAWEDHASTLRQFGLILDALGEDRAWLDPHRPPRALHFAGHMALASADADIGARIRAVIAGERVGFGYGALAAGADIAIAEALLEAGAELHLVLPAPRAAFRERSVAGFGADWTARFDAVIARAASVRTVGSPEQTAGTLAIRLAGEVAMGAAVMQAEVLTTEAIQLLITDAEADSSRGATGLIKTLWARTGRRQHLIAAPRDGPRASPADQGAPRRATLAAMLAVDVATDAPEDSAFRSLAAAIGNGPTPQAPPRWSGEVLRLSYETCAEAAAAAATIASSIEAARGARITGHYGIVRPIDDPFGGPPLELGWSARLPERMLASVPPGAIHVSEDFAAALHGETAPGRFRTEYIGDLPSDDIDDPLRLFSLKP